MKFIVSHDVDHWFLSDHLFKDLYLQKYAVKHFLYLVKRQITWDTYKSRMRLFCNNRMERLREVVEYDRSIGAEPQVFVGYANGLSLSYSSKIAERISKQLADLEVNYFPHGISYVDRQLMKEEKNRWEATLAKNDILRSGIRMHYLRNNQHTYEMYKDLGYQFSSNQRETCDPYFINGVLEFPVTMMDVDEIDLFEESGKVLIEKSIRKIQKLEKAGLKYFTLNFHDVYFNSAFPQHREWFFAVTNYLAKNHEPTDFNSAYTELTRSAG